MAKSLTKRRKVKKVFSRRLQSGWAGCPQDNFWAFKDYARNEIDKKEVAKTIKAYVRENFKADKKVMLEAPEWMFTYPYYIGATIEWAKLGFDFPERWGHEAALEKYFDALKKSAERAILLKVEEEEDDTPKPKKRSIAEIVKERTSDFIADVEGEIDTWSNGVWLDVDGYSVYAQLQKVDAPYNMAKAVYDYYLPQKQEAEELIHKKTKDLVEAYSHMSTKRKNEYLKLLTMIVDEAERYMLSKKAQRKTRVARPKAADKQIKSLKFLKDSSEHQLTSINPVLLVGAMRLYTFNAKSRVLTEYVSRSAKGFEVKGSTLQHVDVEGSRETRLRKPEEFLPIVLKETPTKVSTAWKNLTTKTNTPNSRINKDTLLLRVLDR